jgi:voltage-gated potassium channel
LAYVVPSLALVLVSYGLGVIFFAFAVGTLLSYVLRDEKVTGDKIYGAICVYLFIGLIWGLLFSLLEGLQPGSFSGQTPTPRIEPDPSVLIYYSFITLSTVGYGDIVPISPPARSFAYLEGIIGQFYLAVLVARLVGLHIAYAGAQSERGGVRVPVERR